MVKVFLDSAKPDEILRWGADVDGLTTNPSLMQAAGLTAYPAELLALAQSKPVSLEVGADEFGAMTREALQLSALGPSVYVKIPIMTTQGLSTRPLLADLARRGIRLNVTAIMTSRQVQDACEALRQEVPSIVSIFAGRMADTGVDPVPLIQTAKVLATHSGSEVLWASAREIWNLYQAEAIGCDIITLSAALLEKRMLRGKDLDAYTRETVQMFYDDAHRGHILAAP